jgi:hypothetical protein
MPAIFNRDGEKIGSIEADASGVSSFDRFGRPVGTFQTSVQAVSEVYRRARLSIGPRDCNIRKSLKASGKVGL